MAGLGIDIRDFCDRLNNMTWINYTVHMLDYLHTCIYARALLISDKLSLKIWPNLKPAESRINTSPGQVPLRTRQTSTSIRNTFKAGANV